MKVRYALAFVGAVACSGGGSGGGGGNSSSNPPQPPPPLPPLEFIVRPSQPIAGQSAEYNGNWDTADVDINTDGDGDGINDNDPDLQLGDRHVFAMPGQYLVITSRRDGRISHRVSIRPTGSDEIQNNVMPDAGTFFARSDVATYLEPFMDPADVQELALIDGNLDLSVESIEGIALSTTGTELIYRVGIQDPSQRPGFNDTDGSGETDYFVRFTASAALYDALDFALNTTLNPTEFDQDIRATLPNNAGDPLPGNLVLPTIPSSTAVCSQIINYVHPSSGGTISVGVIRDTATDPISASNQATADAYQQQFRTPGTYIRQSVLVVPDVTTLELRQALFAEYDHHDANN